MLYSPVCAPSFGLSLASHSVGLQTTWTSSCFRELTPLRIKYKKCGRSRTISPLRLLVKRVQRGKEKQYEDHRFKGMFPHIFKRWECFPQSRAAERMECKPDLTLKQDLWCLYHFTSFFFFALVI